MPPRLWSLVNAGFLRLMRRTVTPMRGVPLGRCNGFQPSLTNRFSHAVPVCNRRQQGTDARQPDDRSPPVRRRAGAMRRHGRRCGECAGRRRNRRAPLICATDSVRRRSTRRCRSHDLGFTAGHAIGDLHAPLLKDVAGRGSGHAPLGLPLVSRLPHSPFRHRMHGSSRTGRGSWR